MTLKTKKSKSERALEDESQALDDLAMHAFKTQLYSQSIIRNQVRHRRGERIAAPTPSSPDPVLAAIAYQENELGHLLFELDAMGKAVANLKAALAAAKKDRIRIRSIT